MLERKNKLKIDKIKINGFGKIKNKEIEFHDGINVIYGENEAGKSTILKFIPAMLYGISKNKNGKKISDYEQYLPWDYTDFSGKIKYTLKNDESYEVYRDFKKKKPVIHNSFGEDISNQYEMTKSKEINFFENQVGIDENLFLNTAIIQQQSVKLGKADTNEIVQKISNLVSTGSDNISFQKSIDKINKLQNENVGTDRTKNKPINIVDSNITRLEVEKRNLSNFKDNANNHNDEKAKINLKLEEYHNKKLFIKDLKEIFESHRLQNIELGFERKLKQESEEKINQIKEKIDCEKKKRVIPGTQKLKKNIEIGLSILLFVISIVMYVLVKNVIAGIILDLLALAILVVIIKQNNDTVKDLEKINEQLATEYEIALKNDNKKKQELEEKQKKMENFLKENKKKILDKYKNQIEERYIENKLNLEQENIENEIEMIENSINHLKFEIQMLDSKKEDIDEKLEKLAKVESELAEQKNIRNELESLDISYNLVKECLEKAYEEIKHNISPKFEKTLCDIVSNLTDGKYKKVSVNDEEGMNIESENGMYIPVYKLSDGTIDEMYLALRLSILDEISNENIPIILDETFAYFDNNRLKNILYYLQDNNYDNQIIIFTCTNREEEILNELKIEYNLIHLTK